MTTKTFRAVEQGFHLGRLIQADATFIVDLDAYEDETGDKFEPNWAVEVDDGHAPTPDNAGEQEALDGVLDRDAALPKIAHPDQPLPQFHPALAVDTSTDEAGANSAQKIALDQANAENGDKTVPVRTTADILAEQAAKPPVVETPAEPKTRRSRRKAGENSIDTGTEPSDAEKADAADASKAETDAADKAEGEDDDGSAFV